MDSFRSRRRRGLDHSNLEDLQKVCPPDHLHKLALLLSYLPAQEPGDVPDPYYGSPAGFEEVLRLLHVALDGFVPHLLARLSERR